MRRYKRFFADVMLDDGRAVTAHCPNPGAMLGLVQPGLAVWLEPNDDPRRTLRFGWRLVEFADGWVGIDTGVPNRIVAEALRARRIPALAAYETIQPEVRFGAASRVDFVLRAPGLPPAYVEVKNVHLRRTGDWAEFPDCVTARGARHLAELATVASAGARAVALYVVQRTDCGRMRLAPDLDPGYAAAFDAALAAGVEPLVHRTEISPAGVRLGEEIAFARP